MIQAQVQAQAQVQTQVQVQAQVQAQVPAPTRIPNQINNSMSKSLITQNNSIRFAPPTHLWIRMLVCPWEAFVKQGRCEPRSIGIWPQLSNIGPKFHQHGS